jgi:hypothetical protein
MKLQLRILDDLTFKLNEEFTWTKNEEIEQTVKLGAADGEYSIDLSAISDIKFIVVYSTGPCTVNITKDYISTATAIETLFCYEPSELDRGLITTIGITALNSTPVDVTVKIFGEA